MALRGTVADYGLADVLQLIARGSRSGRLQLENGAEAVDVTVASGTVVDVRTGLAPDGALGSRLVLAGVLNDELLGHALAERARTGRSIANILLNSGALESDVLRRHATLLRWDTVLAPFTWGDGRYAFEEAAIPPTEGWADAIPIDHVLMKGLRLVEEWPRAVERIPSRRWVVARRVPLPPVTEPSDPFSEAFQPSSGSKGVTEEARAVHLLAAPGTRITRLLGQSPYDRFETTLALAELVRGGFVVVTPP